MPAKTHANPDEGWENVGEAARTIVQLNNIGDTFIGFYQGHQTVEDPNPKEDGSHDSWEQYNFIGVFPEDLAQETVAINASKDLREKLENVDPGKYYIRIKLAKKIPVKGQPSPFSSYDVDRKLA